MRSLLKIFLVVLILNTLYVIHPVPVSAAPTPANLLVQYMNTVIDEVTNSHVKLLSPAFNITNTVTMPLVEQMDAAGANWAGLDGFAGNTYTVSGNNALFYYKDYTGNGTISMQNFVSNKHKQIVFTEFGDFGTSDNGPNRPSTINDMKNTFTRATNDSTVLSILYFNALNTNPGFSLHTLSDEELRSITEAEPPKGGVNSGSIVNGSPGGFPAQVTRYYNHTPNLGWTLEIITGPQHEADAVAAINNAHSQGMTPIIRICYGDSCGFTDPHAYAQFLNKVGGQVNGDFYAIAGPNEPDLEHWLVGPVEPFESSIEQDVIFVPELDLERLRGQYVPTYAESPDTHASFGGRTDLCGTILGGFIDCARTLQLTRTDLLPNRTPWLGSEAAAATNTPSDRYLSASTQYSHKAPGLAQPAYWSPLYHLASQAEQFRANLQYLRSIVRKCASLPTEIERRRCALPRTVIVDGEEMTEITFYFRYLSSLTSVDQLSSLPEQVQQVFRQIIPQVREGVEFEIAFWFNYLDDPQDAELNNPSLGSIAQGAVDILHGARTVDIKWVPFLVPVVAGTQVDPAIPDSADATPKQTLNHFLTASKQEQLAVDWQNRIDSRYDALQEPDFATGPCVPCDQDEQCRRDELVHSMAMIINASFYNDCEQLPYGEQANTASIPSYMGLLGMPTGILGSISNFFQSAGDAIRQGISNTGGEDYLQIHLDPTQQGELTIVSRSWILAPPETLKLNITGQEEINVFTPAYLQTSFSPDNNDTFTNYYQMHNGTTTEGDATMELDLQGTIQGILERFRVILQLSTADTPGEETVRGLLFGQTGVGFLKLMANWTQPFISPFSFRNSTNENGVPCTDNLDEADCFYWENGALDNVTTTITRPAPSPTTSTNSTETLVCAPHSRPDGGDGAPDVHEGEDGVFGAPPLNKIIRDAAAKYGIKPCILAGIAMVEAPHIFHEEGPNGYTTAKVNALAAPGAVDNMNCHPNSCTASGPMQMLTGFCGNPQTCRQNYQDPNDPNKYTGGHSWEDFKNSSSRCPNCNVCNLYDSIYAAAAFLNARAANKNSASSAVTAYFGNCGTPLPGYLGGNYNYCGFVEAFCDNSR